MRAGCWVVIELKRLKKQLPSVFFQDSKPDCGEVKILLIRLALKKLGKRFPSPQLLAEEVII
jgi:hypothetical protein